LGLLLALLALGAVVVSGVLLLYLAGEPFRDDGNVCHGGGHVGYGAVMLTTAAASLVSSVGAFVLAGNGRRSWPAGVLSAALLVAVVVLVLNVPDTVEINYGQC